MKLVTTVISRGREFYIVKDEHGFWGIESKHFDNGRLTEKVTGLSGLLSQNVKSTIQNVLTRIEHEHLLAGGVSREAAEAITFERITGRKLRKEA